jgi:hypothetical protein
MNIGKDNSERIRRKEGTAGNGICIGTPSEECSRNFLRGILACEENL